MNWFQARDENYTTPIVKGMRRKKPTARSRTLSDDELRCVWHGSDEVGPTFGGLIKVLLLTAQRRQKVATMRWTDVKDGTWTTAADHWGKRTAGTLRLPKMVLDLIERQPRIVGNPYVFAGRDKGPFNSFSEGKRTLEHR